MRHQGTVCYLIGVDRHIYASVNYTATGTDNGLAPVRCHAIFWINAGLLSIGTNSVKFEPIYEDFHSRMCIWKYTRETIYLWFTHKIYFPQNHRARSLIMTQDYWSSPSLFVVIVRKTNAGNRAFHKYFAGLQILDHWPNNGIYAVIHHRHSCVPNIPFCWFHTEFFISPHATIHNPLKLEVVLHIITHGCNRQIAQIPQCTCPVSHNTPLRNKDVHISFPK